MPKLFISYSHNDASFVDRLIDDLGRYDISVWVDKNELQVGDSLIEKIREGIDKADFFAIVISKSSIKSRFVQRELDVAMTREIVDGGVKVLPLVIEKVDLPSFMKGKVYADFSRDYDVGLGSFLKAINVIPSSRIVMVSVLYNGLHPYSELNAMLFNTGFQKTSHLSRFLRIEVEIAVGYFSYLRGNKDSRGGSPSVFVLNQEILLPIMRN